MYRYRAAGTPQPFPVICGHGMAGTHFIFDLHPRYSLARYLAAHGFDTWLVDLRGRGDSWPDGGPDVRLQWSFDDFVAHDLPTSVERTCELAGAEQAFWLGMEMSGQAVYAAAIAGTARRVRGAVTCGSPVLTPAATTTCSPAPVGWRSAVGERVPSVLLLDVDRLDRRELVVSPAPVFVADAAPLGAAERREGRAGPGDD